MRARWGAWVCMTVAIGCGLDSGDGSNRGGMNGGGNGGTGGTGGTGVGGDGGAGFGGSGGVSGIGPGGSGGFGAIGGIGGLGGVGGIGGFSGASGIGGGGNGGDAGTIAIDAGVRDGGANSACALPFESGSCDAAIPVWAFVPELGACFPHIYGGCGGNENNFASLEECAAACPSGFFQGCPPDRVATEICLECGPTGGCSASSVACARSCFDTNDCLGVGSVSTSCLNGVCQVGGCI